MVGVGVLWVADQGAGRDAADIDFAVGPRIEEEAGFAGDSGGGAVLRRSGSGLGIGFRSGDRNGLSADWWCGWGDEAWSWIDWLNI